MPGLITRKVAPGTRNLAREAAMSREEAAAAIVCGIELAQENIAAGADVLATGEMGIGNTTPAAALAAAFTGNRRRRSLAGAPGWMTRGTFAKSR